MAEASSQGRLFEIQVPFPRIHLPGQAACPNLLPRDMPQEQSGRVMENLGGLTLGFGFRFVNPEPFSLLRYASARASHRGGRGDWDSETQLST